MRGFGQLYKKDLESIGLMTIILGLGIALWDIYFYTRIGQWKAEIAVMPTILPFGVIIFWLVLQAIQVYRHEWQTGGIQLLLALPQPGRKIALAKLAAVLTSFTLNLVVATLGFVWVLRAGTLYTGGVRLFNIAMEAFFQSRAATGWLLQIALGAWFTYWLAGLSIVVVFQLVYNCSRLTTRLRFLVGLASFFVIQWLIGLVGAIGYYVFSWIPDLIIQLPMDTLSRLDPAYGLAEAPVQTAKIMIDSGIVLGNLLGVVLLFIITGYLLQEVLEA